jgi:hypothetical protein
VRLAQAGQVRVRALVAARLPEVPDDAIRSKRGDEKPYWDLERARLASTREVPVELIVNGSVVASRRIVADGSIQPIEFPLTIERSSWVALRILPSSHTNPIFVVVADQPVRASAASAEWCLKSVDRLWSQKMPQIAAREREAAAAAYEYARDVYRRRLAESGPRTAR